MNSDNANGSMSTAEIVSLFRGLYNRVARDLAVDPSYVSRVARGERGSEEVRAALDKEIRQILRQAYALSAGDGARDGHGQPRRKPVRVTAASGKRTKNAPANGNYRSGKAAKATRKNKSSRADTARA